MSQEVKRTLEDLNRVFAEFRQANDERLAQIEAKGTADAALVNKVETLNAKLGELDQVRERLDGVEARANRAEIGRHGVAQTAEVQAHRAGFDAFMRRGIEDGLAQLEVQAKLRTTQDADGGFAVPEELDRDILDRLTNVSPMRQIANVVTVGRGYKKLVNKGGTTSGWVGEEDARPETNTPQLAALEPFWGEIYANPAATQTMLDDVFFNVEAWLAEEIEMEFALQEGGAFITGDGVKKPKGFLAYTTAATGDKTRAFGVLQHIAGGAAAALPANGDKLIDMVQALNPRLRTGAVWTMNSLTTGAIRKLKDSDQNYLWQPGLKEGQPTSLLGYRVVEMEDLPDVAADALPIAFGNFQRGYKITDRIGIRVLRDPFTNKPYIHFYTTKRVGGYVEDANAIKLLKIAV
jgi:HK97 family phage major capsid protein